MGQLADRSCAAGRRQPLTDPCHFKGARCILLYRDDVTDPSYRIDLSE